ncbi:hypothetical protein AOLI_G00325900 [Acnodon oligacanthus]
MCFETLQVRSFQRAAKTNPLRRRSGVREREDRWVSRVVSSSVSLADVAVKPPRPKAAVHLARMGLMFSRARGQRSWTVCRFGRS